MAEILLRRYGRCIEGCSKKGSSAKLTRDHVFPNQVGLDHPPFLEVVNHRKNLIPICRPHHDLIDSRKFSAYRVGGVTGLVLFVAEDYLRAKRTEVELLRVEHFSVLLLTFAGIIEGLNGDTPKAYKEDYLRAQAEAERYGNGFAETFQSEGGFEALGDFCNWQLQYM